MGIFVAWSELLHACVNSTRSDEQQANSVSRECLTYRYYTLLDHTYLYRYPEKNNLRQVCTLKKRTDLCVSETWTERYTYVCIRNVYKTHILCRWRIKPSLSSTLTPFPSLMPLPAPTHFLYSLANKSTPGLWRHMMSQWKPKHTKISLNLRSTIYPQV